MAVGTQAISLSSASAAADRIDWTRPGRAHLVGIGGSGMRSLARVLAQRGWRLSGSDVAVHGLSDVLPTGTLLAAGHRAEGLPNDVDVVISSDAIEPENPERLAAGLRGLPILSYFDAVGQLMEGAHGLAVAGTHGKSTTTAMAAWILVEAGRDPTVLCGAAAIGHSDGGRAGRGSIVLAEACEYRANFLKLRPRHAVLLDIEPDHFDCYPRPADAQRAYGRFVASLPSDGLLLARADSPAVRQAAAQAACRVETFGLDAPGDWSAGTIACRAGRCRGELVYRGHVLCPLETSMPGRHNLLDALAAAALAWHQGVEPAAIAQSLGRFPGVRRRLETAGTWRGATTIEDFAHHPTELAATLATVRQMYPDRRVCCVFQPHQASRTARLLDELAASLHNGLRPGTSRRSNDRLWIAEIYRAREGPPAPGEVTAADLADRVRALGSAVSTAHEIEKVAGDLDNEVRDGDVLLVIGAGDIGKILEH